MGGSIGGNKSESKGNNMFSSDIWGEQGDALKDLYGQASNLFGGSSQFQDKINEAAGGASEWGKGIMDKAQGGYNDLLGGGSFGDTSDVRAKLMGMMGQGGTSQMGDMYNSIVGGEGNTYVDPMVDAMKQGAMENNAMLQSGNSMDAAAMGQGGGSRHAMQNAMTNRMTNQDMMNQETAMRGGAYDKDLAMKMDIARNADSNALASKQGDMDTLFGMLGGSDANKQYGMGQSGNMQGMGMGNMNPWMQAQQSAWNPMMNWASILGDPTVLKSGSGSTDSSSKGANVAGGIWG